MFVGYARVSTGEQKLDLQLDALKQAGCERIFTDQISGTKAARPGLDEAMAYVRAGDTRVVWRLDRFGRSFKDLVTKIEDLKAREVGFCSLQESMDTTSPTGKLVFHFAFLARQKRITVDAARGYRLGTPAS